MRAVVQRVSSARVTVASETVGAIGTGLLAYVAAAADDGPDDIAYVADKLCGLRVFPDDAGKLNRDVSETAGAILLVSAFTVLADARKGRRPSLDGSAGGAIAQPLFDQLCLRVRTSGVRIECGRFGADMQVHSSNDGPICILLDSRRAF